MKTFYLHEMADIRYESGRKRNGLTAKIAKTDKPNIVTVQIASCSRKDNYCRKKGREVCETKPVAEMHLKDLSKYLQKESNKILWGFEYEPTGSQYDWVPLKLLD